MPWFTPKPAPVKNTPWPLKPEATKQQKEEGFKIAFVPVIKKDGTK